MSEVNKKHGLARTGFYYAVRRDEMYIPVSPDVHVQTAAISMCVDGNEYLKSVQSNFKMGVDISSSYPGFTLYLMLNADGGHEVSPLIKFTDEGDNHLGIEIEETSPIVLTVPIPYLYSKYLSVGKEILSLLGYTEEYINGVDIIEPEETINEDAINIFEAYNGEDDEVESESEPAESEE